MVTEDDLFAAFKNSDKTNDSHIDELVSGETQHVNSENPSNSSPTDLATDTRFPTLTTIEENTATANVAVLENNREKISQRSKLMMD